MKKLYLWEEGLWHRCWAREWRASKYTIKEFKCYSCQFTNPWLEVLIPFLKGYAKATPNIEGAPWLNSYYYTHEWIIDKTNFKKERILVK